jgi:hypothetical protein
MTALASPPALAVVPAPAVAPAVAAGFAAGQAALTTPTPVWVGPSRAAGSDIFSPLSTAGAFR